MDPFAALTVADVGRRGVNTHLSLSLRRLCELEEDSGEYGFYINDDERLITRVCVQQKEGNLK